MGSERLPQMNATVYSNSATKEPGKAPEPELTDPAHELGKAATNVYCNELATKNLEKHLSKSPLPKGCLAEMHEPYILETISRACSSHPPAW